MKQTATTAQARLGDDSSRPVLVDRQHWEFSSKNTLDSTHALHPYVASMNPHLARELVRRYAGPGRTLLDPFCGGGAVPVEALRSGVQSVGLDVNPLAVLLAKVKTTHVPKEPMEEALRQVAKAVHDDKVDVPDFPPGTKIDFWFHSHVIEELTQYRQAILDLPPGDVRDAFKVVFSGVVRDVSLTYRGEVRLRRLRGKDLDHFQPDVAGRFRERSRIAIQRLADLPVEPSAKVLEGSIIAAPFEDDSLGAIACSPPYADDRNGVGYFQFSKNMLFWLGFSQDDLRAARDRFLGHNPGPKGVPDSPTLGTILTSMEGTPVPSNPRAIDECVAFYHDYALALGEMTRVCDGPIAIVIGDRTLSRTFIDNAAITTELMAAHGRSLSEYFYRTIDKKRIPVMKPGGGQRDTSGGGLINKEHTLVYAPA